MTEDLPLKKMAPPCKIVQLDKLPSLPKRDQKFLLYNSQAGDTRGSPLASPHALSIWACVPMMVGSIKVQRVMCSVNSGY